MNTYGHFQTAYKRASVNTMDQNKLIVMLYDGAIRHIGQAVEKMKGKDIEGIHSHLVKAKNIVSELMASLNMEKGGDIAKNLQALYVFMFGQLIEANVRKDPAPAESVAQLLRELRQAWVAIGSQGKQQAQPQSRPAFAGGGDAVKRVNLKG